MKNIRNKIKIIEFPMFSDFIVHVELTSDPQKTLDKYRFHDVDIEDCAGLTIGRNDGHCFIFLPHSVPINSIVHESSHAIDRLMYFIGADDGEIRAYLLGYLVDQIRKLKKKK